MRSETGPRGKGADGTPFGSHADQSAILTQTVFFADMAR